MLLVLFFEGGSCCDIENPNDRAFALKVNECLKVLDKSLTATHLPADDSHGESFPEHLNPIISSCKQIKKADDDTRNPRQAAVSQHEQNSIIGEARPLGNNPSTIPHDSARSDDACLLGRSNLVSRGDEANGLPRAEEASGDSPYPPSPTPQHAIPKSSKFSNDDGKKKNYLKHKKTKVIDLEDLV